MRSAIAFGVAALAGSALAAPSYGGGVKVFEDVHVVVETVLNTVYVTEGTSTSCTSTSTPTPTPEAAYAPPVVSIFYPPPPPAPTTTTTKPTPTPVYTPPPPPPPPSTPSPSAAPAPSSAPSTPSTGGYIDIIKYWRAELDLPSLEYDPKLEKNALKTVTDSHGAMVHQLLDGSMGQVLAPGPDGLEGFKHCWLGGWLCEVPTLKGLGDACKTASNGWDYQGQTGHAKICTDTSYTRVGCGWSEGIWGCDFA